MEDDPGAAEDERAIELSSIAAIFPELVIDPSSPYCASLDLAVTPVKPLRLTFKTSADSAPPVLPTPPTSTEQGSEGNAKALPKKTAPSASSPPADEHALSHLPPLTLNIVLPEGYPAEEPPIVHLSLSPTWLPRTTLRNLKGECARLWEEIGKDQVVFTYIDHLQQAAETAFGLITESDSNVHLPSDLKLALLDFDLKTKREVFEKETFNCGICLEPKKGIACHRLMLCSHVFCVACLQDFYNNCIKEGDVDNVKCLSPDCGKETASGGPDGTGRPKKRRKQDRTLNPSELLQIPLEQEIIQRFVRLKRKKRLEADKNTIYCPRQWCQGAARSKKHPKPIDPFNDVGNSMSESEDDNNAEIATNTTQANKKKPDEIPMSERLAICEDCAYAFCSVCKKGWHGELSNCNPRRQQELNEEEQASMQYLTMHTTPCPTCSAPSQKTMGCNHMICFKCRTHFCYLCSSYLMPDNPYRHFNDMKSRCYMRLWELEGGDGDDVGLGYAGGPGRGGWDDDSDDDSDTSLELTDDDDDDLIDFDDDDDDDADFVFNIHQNAHDDDTDDEEPAPDQRRPNRNMQVEFINFAREGAANQRIIHQIPEPPRAAPPAAPVPPPHRGRDRRRQQANRERLLQQEPHRAMIARPRPAPIRPPVAVARPQEDADLSDEEDFRPMIRAAPAPGQGNGAAQQPAPVRQLGLERFLQLAAQDEEDEWDSDELDEEELEPIRHVPRNFRNDPRRNRPELR